MYKSSLIILVCVVINKSKIKSQLSRAIYMLRTKLKGGLENK